MVSCYAGWFYFFSTLFFCGLFSWSVRPCQGFQLMPNNSFTSYGGSCVKAHLLLSNASSSKPVFHLEVKLVFRTALENVAILHIERPRDEYLLELDNGRLKVTVSSGRENVKFLSPTTAGQLSDGKWHRVVVRRFRKEFYVGIDQTKSEFAAQARLPEDIPKSCILSLGGPCSKDSASNGASSRSPSFRGCIKDISITNYAATVNDSNFGNFKHSCDEDVFSPANDLMQFHSRLSNAQIFLQGPSSFGHLDLHLELKTRSKNSLLASIIPFVPNSAKIELTVENGRLKLKINSGTRTWSGSQPMKISDGKWHEIDVRKLDRDLYMRVDNVSEILLTSIPLDISPQNWLTFGNFLANSAIDSAYKSSFIGCLSNAVFNFEPIHWTKLSSTVRVAPGCGYAFPCAQAPCHPSQTCVEIRDREKICSCPAGSICQKSKSKKTRHGHGLQSDVQVRRQSPIHVSPLEVKEGQSVRVRLENLNLQFFNQDYNMSNSDIRYDVIRKPQRGKLTIWDQGSNRHVMVRHFSNDDLLRGRVNYTHDGSETREDDLLFSLAFPRSVNFYSGQFESPTKSYRLPIIVLAVNDPPELVLKKSFNAVESSKMRLTHNEIYVSDTDTKPEDLKIHVSSLNSGGFVTNEAESPLSVFTFNDLISGRVFLKTFLPGQIRLKLYVQDAKTRSKEAVMTVNVESLDIRLAANSGLKVLHGGSELITRSNLSVATNAVNMNDSYIVYNIVRNPRFGFVQVLVADTNWTVSDKFTQADVYAERVRYRQKNAEKPKEDFFQFKVIVQNKSSDEYFDFKVIFTPITLKVFMTHPFRMVGITKKTITKDFLFIWTYPKQYQPRRITYAIQDAPRRGFLYKIIRRGRHRRLGIGFNFTEQEMIEGRIYYKLNNRYSKQMADKFKFRVVTPTVGGREATFPIYYSPGNESVRVTNRTLFVHEGGLAKITREFLWLASDNHNSFSFKILVPTKHGEILETFERDQSFKSLHRGSSFNSYHLFNNMLLYRHDDSETTEDSMLLTADPIDKSHGTMNYQVWFNIKISLQNDNPPRREYYVMKRTNKFVTNMIDHGEKVLSQRDLYYVDDDTDFDSKSIRYNIKREDQQLAGIFRAEYPTSRVTSFTQDDVNNHRVLMRHSGGTKRFEVPFTVTDGKYHVPGSLTVNASAEIYLEEEANKGIFVSEGLSVIISRNELSYFCNFKLSATQIVYNIISFPSYGELILINSSDDLDKSVAENITSVDEFTQHDIDLGRLVYRSKGPPARSRTDDFAVTIGAGQYLSKTVKVHVSIQLQNEAKLRVVKNEPLVVARGGIVGLDSESLQVKHLTEPDRNIIFQVTSGARYGKLIRGNGTLHNHDILAVAMFTQEEVNFGQLQYMHDFSKHFADEKVHFNVSAGTENVPTVVLTVRIVDHQISIVQKNNITVKSGQFYKIDQTIFYARSSLYAEPFFNYVIKRAPKRGSIVKLTPDGWAKVDTFTSNDMKHGVISYHQNDNTNLRYDNFEVTARLDEGTVESEPVIIYVSIQYENKVGPRVTSNKALQTWGAGLTLLTPASLLAEDRDTPPEEIVYQMPPKEEGYIAKMDDPSQRLKSFTQLDIDQERLGFVRAAQVTKVELPFFVTDGVHYTEGHKFVVFTKRLDVDVDQTEDLYVAPNKSIIIPARLLHVHLEGISPGRIIFGVKAPPRFGTLTMNAMSVKEFTQADVDENKVVYNQREVVREWLTKDSFEYSIGIRESQFDSGSRQILDSAFFKIVVSFGIIDSEQAGRLVVTKPVAMDSDRVTITEKFLNVIPLREMTKTDIVMTILNLPQKGHLQFRGQNMSSGFNFRNQDLVEGYLVYYIDRPFVSNSGTQKLEIVITPDNEDISMRAMELRVFLDIILPTEKKMTSGLRVHTLADTIILVQGYDLNITNDHFHFINAEVPPTKIKFRVIQGPSIAKFYKASKPAEEAMEFTQAEVNDGELRLAPKIGPILVENFKFQVSDGEVTELYDMRLQIDEVKITLKMIKTVKYYQLESKEGIVINNTHLGTFTNGDRRHVIYKLTRPPTHGQIFYGHNRVAPASRFTQVDIDDKLIIYVLDNLNHGTDSFNVSISHVFDRAVPIDVECKIRAIPELVRSPAVVKPGARVVLTQEMLNARNLLVTTKKDPVFLITQAPEYGYLERKDYPFPLRDESNSDSDQNPTTFVESSNDPTQTLNSPIQETSTGTQVQTEQQQQQQQKREIQKHITKFTFADLGRSLIRYVSYPSATKEITQRDVFRFQLVVNGEVPPASGYFEIYITPDPDKFTIESYNEGIIIEQEDRPPPKPVLPDMKVDHLIAVAAAIAVSVLAGFLIVVCKVRISLRQQSLMRRRQQPYEKAQPSIPPALENQQPDIVRTSIYSPSSNPNLREMMENEILGTDDREPLQDPSALSHADATMTQSLRGAPKGRMSLAPENTGSLPPSYLKSRSIDEPSSPASPGATSRLTTFEPRPSLTDMPAGVPLCRVTPLSGVGGLPGRANLGVTTVAPSGPHSNHSSSSEAFDDPLGRYAYQYSSSASDQESRTGDRAALRPRKSQAKGGPAGQIRQMKLKDNQYWV